MKVKSLVDVARALIASAKSRSSSLEMRIWKICSLNLRAIHTISTDTLKSGPGIVKGMRMVVIPRTD